jgi:predicted component of type VI protein secretion system
MTKVVIQGGKLVNKAAAAAALAILLGTLAGCSSSSAPYPRTVDRPGD